MTCRPRSVHPGGHRIVLTIPSCATTRSQSPVRNIALQNAVTGMVDTLALDPEQAPPNTFELEPRLLQDPARRRVLNRRDRFDPLQSEPTVAERDPDRFSHRGSCD